MSAEPGARRYPAQPVVGVGAVVIVGDRIVLVRRAQPPLEGRWSLPGGRLELGETLEEGVRREVLEETGLAIAVGPVIDVFDRIATDPDGRIEYHYVLVDFVAWAAGDPAAASDVSEVALADPAALAPFALQAKTLSVVVRAIELARERAQDGLTGPEF